MQDVPKPYHRQFLLTFGEVDWARILYFPNLFHICHSTLEAWFAEQSGQHYAVILSERRIGFPTVHIAADFVKPMPYGITLDIAMHVTRLGSSSVSLTYLVRAVGETAIRARVRHVVACVDMEVFSAIPLPTDLRDAFARFLAPIPESGGG